MPLTIPFDHLAPYPDKPEDVTADALAKHLAAAAYRTFIVDVPPLMKQWEAAKLPRTGPLRDAYVYAVASVCGEYATVLLLREASKPEGDRLPLDELVRRVNQPHDGWMDEMVASLEAWLEGWGVDLDALLADEPADAAEVPA